MKTTHILVLAALWTALAFGVADAQLATEPAAPVLAADSTRPDSEVPAPDAQPTPSVPGTTATDTQTLARKAQNPISDMVSLPFQYNSQFGAGPNSQTTHTLNIQPVIPVQAGDWNLVNRTIIPISYVPNSAVPPPANQGQELGFGDVNYQLYFVPANSGGFTWGVGPTLTLPTGSDAKLGSGKWLAGPNAVVLTMQGRWVVGTLLNQQWSFAGDSSRPEVSVLTAQPFVCYNFDDGWYLTSAPIITANWQAPGGEKWTIPLGGGFGRIFSMGDQKVNVQLQGFSNIEKPTGGPDWGLRLQFTLLFPD